MAIGPIELENALADDSLEMNEAGDKLRVALELQDAIASHHTHHQDGGPDELDVTGLSGELADPQKSKAHKASHQDGGADELVVTGLSGKLADAQTPLAHATTHATGGSDPISLATTSVDGLMPATAASKLAGIPSAVVSVVGSITAVAGNIYLVDISGNTVTVTLPPAAANAGKQIIIKHAKGDPPNHLFVGGGGATIDGRATIDLDILYQWVGLVCDGVAWYTYADSLVANKLQVSGDTVFKTIGAIATTQIMRRNAADSIVGGPVTMDDAGNLRSVGLINDQPLIGLTAVSPTQIQNVAANAGSSGAAARADHIHDVLFAAPVALAVGGGNALGSGPAIAFSDHKHALPAFGSAAGTFCEGNDPRLTAALVNPATNGFRLSTTAADPLSPLPGGTHATIYLTPYNGNTIALYSGTVWKAYASPGTSLPLSGLITDRPCDVFAYDNGGVVTLELFNWTSASLRTTAIVRQDGVWVKSGALTRRYLGTIVGFTATTIKHDNLRCGIWNVSNRVDWMFAESWPAGPNNPAATSTWQQLGAAFEYVAGVAEDWLEATVIGACDVENSSAALAVGFDGSLTPGGIRQNIYSSALNTFLALSALSRYQVVGFHRVAGLIFATSTAAKFVGQDTVNVPGLACRHRY